MGRLFRFCLFLFVVGFVWWVLRYLSYWVYLITKT